MFVNRARQQYLSKNYLWLWVALAFQAGFVNAGGFLATARFVSHMTGFGTQVGISLAGLDYLAALEILSAPLFFMLGAMVSALAVDRPMIAGRPPRHLWVMFFMFAVFLIVSTGGTYGLFGTFGEPLLLLRDFELLCLLCFACGMQNACFGSLTQGQIRTTHMTGILTDIGVSFVKIFYMNGKSRDSKLLRRVNSIRLMTFTSFYCGSAVSAVLFSRLGYLAFWFLVASSLGLWLAVLSIQKAIDRKRRSGEIDAGPNAVASAS